MRLDAKSLAKAVDQLSFHYSKNLVCILLLMLQWESINRPDFVTLDTLIKNEILQSKSQECLTKLYNLLIDTMTI